MADNNLDLLSEIKNSIDDVKAKLDYILHPKNGIFAELQKINAKADAAHRRIDMIENSKLRYRRWRERVIAAVTGGVILFIINKILEKAL